MEETDPGVKEPKGRQTLEEEEKQRESRPQNTGTVKTRGVQCAVCRVQVSQEGKSSLDNGCVGEGAASGRQADKGRMSVQ